MAYLPFDFIRLFPILIYFIILSVLGLIITIKMFRNYKKKKHPAALYLSLSYGLLTLAIIGLAIGFAEGAITGYFKEIYRFSIPFGYSMVILADICLFKFTNQLTDKGKKAFIPLYLIGAVLIILLFLPWNYWGVPNEEIGKPYIRLYSTMGVVLFSLLIYISIILMCHITKKYLDNKINKVRLSLLSYSMISLILFFIMSIGDTILIVVYHQPGYSIFGYIAWIFACVFFILSYFSLFMPKRLLKWIEKHSENI